MTWNPTNGQDKPWILNDLQRTKKKLDDDDDYHHYNLYISPYLFAHIKWYGAKCHHFIFEFLIQKHIFLPTSITITLIVFLSKSFVLALPLSVLFQYLISWVPQFSSSFRFDMCVCLKKMKATTPFLPRWI